MNISSYRITNKEGNEVKICGACTKLLPSDNFSNKQWKQKQRRRCKACTDVGKEIDLAVLDKEITKIMNSLEDDDDDAVVLSPSPPRITPIGTPLRFQVGDRVECNMRIGWAPGVVESLRFDDKEYYNAVVPYKVGVDGGYTLFAPVDEDTCIRKSLKLPPVDITKTDDLRFKVGDRVVVNCLFFGTEQWMPGLIAELFGKHPKDSKMIVPYLVKLDSRVEIPVSFDDDWFVRMIRSGPITIDFPLGAQVECNLAIGEDKWISGTVVQNTECWEKLNYPPYKIKFEDDRLGEQCFYGPRECIRASKSPGNPPSRVVENGLKQLRFKVGTRVECMTETGLNPGTVIKHWYGKNDFDNDFKVPYQIQLDNGQKIYAPYDVDACIRQSTVPAPECWVCFDNTQSESNLIVRDCVCRGVGAGFVHIECLVKLAISKTDHLERIGDNDPNPFSKCITCHQDFEGHSKMALAKACFDRHQKATIGSYWNMLSINLMSQALRESDDEGAENFLTSQIVTIRLHISRMSIGITPTNVNNKQILERYLAKLYLKLASVYEEKADLVRLKAVLDESRSLSDKNDKNFNASLAHHLARYSYLTGDKHTSLKYFEQVLQDNPNSNILLCCAVLNYEFGSKEKCVKQFERALSIITPVHGENSQQACVVKEILCKIRDGSIEKFPLRKLGLYVLERGAAQSANN